MDETNYVQEPEVITETPVFETDSIPQGVEVEVVEAEVVEGYPVESTPAVATCDSCGTTGELFDVPHHRADTNIVWHYCTRCKNAHQLEVGTNERLLEVMAVNPEAVNDPAFVQDIRTQLTKEQLLS